MGRNQKLLGAGIVAFVWLPLVAVLALAVVIFGWRVPVVLALFSAAVVLKARWVARSLRAGRPVPWRAPMLVLVAVGAVAGWVARGGAGVLIGVVLGVAFGFPIPRELLPGRR